MLYNISKFLGKGVCKNSTTIMCKKTSDKQPQIFLKRPKNQVFCNGYYIRSQLLHIVGLLKNTGQKYDFSIQIYIIIVL